MTSAKLSQAFRDIVKIDAFRFRLISLYGMLFFGIFLLFSVGFNKLMGVIADGLGGTGGDIASAVTANSQQSFGMLMIVLVMLLLYFVVSIALYSFFENLIWGTIVKRKTTAGSVLRFTSFNVIMIALFLLIMALVTRIISPVSGNGQTIGTFLFFVQFLIALAFAYCLYVGYYILIHEQKLFRSLRLTFAIGTKAAKHMALHYVIGCLMLIPVWIVLLPTYLIPQQIAAIVEIIAFSIYLAWFRLYFADALKSVKL